MMDQIAVLLLQQNEIHKLTPLRKPFDKEQEFYDVHGSNATRIVFQVLVALSWISGFLINWGRASALKITCTNLRKLLRQIVFRPRSAKIH